MPWGFSGDTGTRVTTNRTQCPPSGSHHENLPVEIEKPIEGRVARLGHNIELSYSSNTNKDGLVMLESWEAAGYLNRLHNFLGVPKKPNGKVFPGKFEGFSEKPV